MQWLIRAMLLAVGVILDPGAGFAQSPVGSSSNPCSGIPNCELQPQATIKFGPDDTKGWAFYCTGDHLYYWGGYYAADYNRWTQSNNCFTTAENNASEVGYPNKLDVTVTNWCLKDEDYTISIACSVNPPPNYAPACGSGTESQPIFKDPGCPIQGNIKNICNGLQTQFCFQNWTEQCSNNIQYWCSLDIYLDLTSCTPCTN